MTRRTADLSRRRFLALSGLGGTCLLVGRPGPVFGESQSLVAEEPWACIVELGASVWAVASTPTKSSNWTTGCNGGIVAGSERVLTVEGFLRPEGASWVDRIAEELSGRRPTDVLVTHYHGDHASGLEGYAERGDPPRIWMTETTRELIRQDDSSREGGVSEVRLRMLADASIVPSEGVTEVDLGGRTVQLHPRSGHTRSDVTVEVEEPSVVFFGDLLWNGFFPNYRDTIPTPFAASVRATRRARQTQYVPGHGALADDHAVGLLLTLIDSIEEAARSAFEQGIPAADAAAEFQLPAAVSDWVLFNPRYFEVAIGAWHKELGETESGA
jgi:glyoxylase-like metal-dependent hydrolase (beta-lactamase superfamily II)